MTACIGLLIALTGVALPGAVLFCVLSGISLGLLSPLNGLLQAEVFGGSRLGTLSGVTVGIASFSSASGTFLSGVLLDWTGSYALFVAAIVILNALTILSVNWVRSARDERGVDLDAVAI
jgi:MFS family permease